MMIIAAKYEKKDGSYGGREYHFRAGNDIEVGDLVYVPVGANDKAKALVCEVNVLESKVDERYLPNLRSVLGLVEV